MEFKEITALLMVCLSLLSFSFFNFPDAINFSFLKVLPTSLSLCLSLSPSLSPLFDLLQLTGMAYGYCSKFLKSSKFYLVKPLLRFTKNLLLIC